MSQSKPSFLPLSINLQARDAFFAYYVNGTCWDFLRQYYHPTDCAGHVSLAIEAVSLAYLWHHVYSDTALATARERYVIALRMTNQTLQSSTEATKATTLVVSLLLDLFEKMTDGKSWDKAPWTSHVNGALALVKVRGLEHFQEPPEFRILQRISTNFLLGYIASGLPVPDEIVMIRDYVVNYYYGQDPVQRFSDLMIQYASLRSDIRRGLLSDCECVKSYEELDRKLQAVDLDMPPSWQYTTTVLDYASDRTFGFSFDSYPHRNICLGWNVLRVVRILINEILAKHYSAICQGDKSLPMIEKARQAIRSLTSEICASISQYVDCDGVARRRLPTLEDSISLNHSPRVANHFHTPNHQADCYTLLFPLYAAGRAEAGSDIGPWVTKQLHYMGSHFHIRNAEVIAQLLEKEADVCPWQVYAMLGSYAFTV